MKHILEDVYVVSSRSVNMKKVLMRFTFLASVMGLLAVVGGCTPKQKATATGAAVGAVAGAGLGGLAGGEGALIGAVSGGLFGGLIGNASAQDAPAAPAMNTTAQ